MEETKIKAKERKKQKVRWVQKKKKKKKEKKKVINKRKRNPKSIEQWNRRKKKKNCLLVGKENFVKNKSSHFYFRFLSNLKRSNFGGSEEKIARLHHFSLLPSFTNKQTPPPPHPPIFSPILHFFFLLFSPKSSQPNIP